MLLIIICAVSVPKFSPFIRTKAAAASSPTTPGRSPQNTASTAGCFWYFKKKRLITTMRMKEGSTTDIVAIVDPNTPKACEYPALTTAT